MLSNKLHTGLSLRITVTCDYHPGGEVTLSVLSSWREGVGRERALKKCVGGLPGSCHWPGEVCGQVPAANRAELKRACLPWIQGLGTHCGAMTFTYTVVDTFTARNRDLTGASPTKLGWLLIRRPHSPLVTKSPFTNFSW